MNDSWWDLLAYMFKLGILAFCILFWVGCYRLYTGELTIDDFKLTEEVELPNIKEYNFVG